jgi:hypothetical protein
MRKNYGKKTAASRLRYCGKIALLCLVLVLSVSTCTSLRLFSRIKFFYMMDRVPAWTTVGFYELETYPLDDLKQIARFLLEQPEQDRRRMIAAYCAYAEPRTDDLALLSKLYLLLRLLFDVPEDADVAAVFGGWMGEGGPYPYDGSETINLLWPLGYQDHRLVLKSGLGQYLGAPYNGLAEYDYFASHFLWRTMDELE